MSGSSDKKHPWTLKRIAALCAIVLLAGLYVLTLVFAVAGFEGARELFMACLFLTIAVPILTWLLIWLIGALKGKHTIASPDIFRTGQNRDTSSDVSDRQDAE
ncbi:MAG: hypothetical protein J6P87_03145 [Lachnospiraceae bacterium]|nr:hypothetical protein [Lachnospiraceae bacterium]